MILLLFLLYIPLTLAICPERAYSQGSYCYQSAEYIPWRNEWLLGDYQDTHALMGYVSDDQFEHLSNCPIYPRHYKLPSYCKDFSYVLSMKRSIFNPFEEQYQWPNYPIGYRVQRCVCRGENYST
jgi:hypothetical protein